MIAWRYAIRLAKWQVIVSLAPFIFPLTYAIGEAYVALGSPLDSLIFELLPISVAVDITLTIEFFIVLILLIGTLVSQPFEPILQPLGWWSDPGDILVPIAPSFPLLPGSFAVAIIYSIVIYLTLSFLSAWKRK